MKYSKFSTLPGSDPTDKLAELFRRAYRLTGSSFITGQTKYNGVHVRLINGDFYTRRGEQWDLAVLPDSVLQLREFSFRKPLHTFHFELFSQTVPFEQYVGAVSVINKSFNPLANQGTFRIFDVGTPVPMDYLCRLRIAGEAGFPIAQLAVLKTPAAAESFYDLNISQGEEGVIYRIPPCYYSDDTTPHNLIYKRKILHQAEGICEGVSEGKGKRTGMLGSMYLRLPNGLSLAVGGGKGLNDVKLKHYYLNPPLGLSVTYSYEDTADNGMPLRPQLVAVRNYE